jgi:hypothetical protein
LVKSWTPQYVAGRTLTHAEALELEARCTIDAPDQAELRAQLVGFWSKSLQYDHGIEHACWLIRRIPLAEPILGELLAALRIDKHRSAVREAWRDAMLSTPTSEVVGRAGEFCALRAFG